MTVSEQRAMFEGALVLRVLRVFQSFGLISVRLDRTLTPTRSPSVIWYILLLMAGFLLVFVDGFRDQGVVPDFQELARILTDVIVFGLTFISVMAIYIQTICTREAQVQILVYWNEVDFLFQTKLRVREPRKLSRNIIKLAILAFLFIFQEGSTAVAVFELNQYVTYWIHIVVPVVLAAMRTFQFIFFVDMLSYRLALVNECLENLAAFEDLGFDEQFERKFGAVKEIYGKLLEVFGLQNEVFGNSMLFVVFQIFVFICTNTYWSILQHTEKISSIFPLDPVAHILNLSVQLFLLVESCESCARKASEMKVLVDKLSWECNRTIQDFALQISHYDFVMTANGYFKFNYGLLGSVYGSVITYIVIMAQLEDDKDTAEEPEVTTLSTLHRKKLAWLNM